MFRLDAILSPQNQNATRKKSAKPKKLSLPEVDGIEVRDNILSGGSHVVLELLVQTVVHHHHHLGVPRPSVLSAMSWQCLVILVTHVCQQLRVIIATGGHVGTCQTVPSAGKTRATSRRRVPELEG